MVVCEYVNVCIDVYVLGCLCECVWICVCMGEEVLRESCIFGVNFRYVIFFNFLERIFKDMRFI